MASTTTARSKTRSQSGITVPRKVEAVAEPAGPKKSTKANTSKPRTEAVASGRVTKPATKKTPVAKAKKVVKKVEEKVNGAVEKTEKKAAPKKVDTLLFTRPIFPGAYTNVLIHRRLLSQRPRLLQRQRWLRNRESCSLASCLPIYLLYGCFKCIVMSLALFDTPVAGSYTLLASIRTRTSSYTHCLRIHYEYFFCLCCLRVPSIMSYRCWSG